MGAVINQRFIELIKQIPEEEYNVQQVMNLFTDFCSSFAEEFGMVHLTNQICRPGEDRMTMVETPPVTVFHVDYEGQVKERNYKFSMGNGGHVHQVLSIKNEIEWTQEQEEEMYALMKSQFLFMGRTQAMSDLKKAILTDAMTEIPNKVGLYKFLMPLIGRGLIGSFCANFINIKNMKMFNEKYTENGGNQILIRFAKMIESFAGENGCAARLGGDNYLVVIENEKEEDFLNKIKNVKMELVDRDGYKSDIVINSRVGYYFINQGDHIEEIMTNSSVANRVARGNRNSDIVKFEDRYKAEFMKTKQLEARVPEALANEEFVVYYQPKVIVEEDGTYTLCGSEALVRWIKDDELIMPGQFISLLEKNGMIAKLDFYMLEHVCKDLRDWIDRGLKPVTVSINFSRRHLKNDQVDKQILEIVNKYGIDTSLLEIEITESYDDEDMGVLSRFEQKMHALNIDVSVDDFGSGFSSLKMIKNIVTDTIKLDKSIIDGIGEAREDNIIISHIISMINDLGKNIIAEGVETVEQAEFLRDNGCNKIQGYLFSKPIPKAEYEKLL